MHVADRRVDALDGAAGADRVDVLDRDRRPHRRRGAAGRARDGDAVRA